MYIYIQVACLEAQVIQVKAQLAQKMMSIENSSSQAYLMNHNNNNNNLNNMINMSPISPQSSLDSIDNGSMVMMSMQEQDDFCFQHQPSSSSNKNLSSSSSYSCDIQNNNDFGELQQLALRMMRNSRQLPTQLATIINICLPIFPSL